ncbi:MAG: hypothetical protein M4579_000222 [Chaenotheca gracillima]|nr:MAG: hypothetical protein M4579_000222 [Chaenotheca gracillima]
METTISGPPPDGNLSKGPIIIGMTALWTGLAVVFVALRMTSRFFVLKSVGWDDWCIVAAALGTVIGAGLDFPEIHYGFGRHRYYLTDHQYREYLKYGYGEWIQTFATLTFTKVSICLFLLRIAISKALVRPIQTGIVILVVSNIVLTVLWVVQCRPIDAAWILQRRPTASCFSKGQMERIVIAQAIISAISDFVLAAFPILMLRNLHVSLRKKIGLCVLMGLGVITGACCVVRTILNWQTQAPDLTWGGIDNWAWRCIEVNVGIIAACIPTLLPGYRFVKHKVHTITGTGTNASSSYNRDRDRATYWRGHPRTPRKSYGEQPMSISEKIASSPFAPSRNDSVHRPHFSGSTDVTITNGNGYADLPGGELSPPQKAYTKRLPLTPRDEEHAFPRKPSNSSTLGAIDTSDLGLSDHDIMKTTTVDVERPGSFGERRSSSSHQNGSFTHADVGATDWQRGLSPAPAHSQIPVPALAARSDGTRGHNHMNVDSFDSSDNEDLSWLRMTESRDPLAGSKKNGPH